MTKVQTERLIYPAHLALKAMQDTPYETPAHALAELIDNSVQAGEDTGRKTKIDIIGIQQRVSNRRRIDSIAVLDNGCGMDKNTLWGALQFGQGVNLDAATRNNMGKYGMGLPTASINQAKKVDVWSWQGSKCYHAFLDIRKVIEEQQNYFPEPTKSAVPEGWLKISGAKLGKSGTLVRWSHMNLNQWALLETFFKHSEKIIGRTHRHFLTRDTDAVQIKFTAFEQQTDESWKTKLYPEDTKGICRPNDPLYLMDPLKTSAPSPTAGNIIAKPLQGWKEKDRPFNLYGDPDVIKINGYDVVITSSVVNKAVRLGHLQQKTPFSTHAKHNQGISIVREDRELTKNGSWFGGDPWTERWWSIEIKFPNQLDAVFGVDNTKQRADRIRKIDLATEANDAGFDTQNKYIDDLKKHNDPRYLNAYLNIIIDTKLRNLRAFIKAQAQGAKGGKEGGDPTGAAAARATRAREKRMQDGHVTEQDKLKPNVEKTTQDLIAIGVDPKDAERTAKFAIKHDWKYIFELSRIPGDLIFDHGPSEGITIITLNNQHLVTERIIDEIGDPNSENDHEAVKALKVLFASWSRMESECTDNAKRRVMERLRGEWSRMATDFLDDETYKE